MTTPTTPAAGWYPEPGNPALIRYWDGTAWQGQPQPAAQVPPAGFVPPAAIPTPPGTQASWGQGFQPPGYNPTTGLAPTPTPTPAPGVPGYGQSGIPGYNLPDLGNPTKAAKRNKRTIIGFSIIVGLFALVAGIGAYLNHHTPTQSTVASEAEGCKRWKNTLITHLHDSNVEVKAQLRSLRNASKQNAPLLAAELDKVLNADTDSGVRDASAATGYRCAASGYLTRNDIQDMADAIG